MFYDIFAGSIKFKSSVPVDTALWSVFGGQLEAAGLTFLHDSSSRGPFIAVSAGGVVAIGTSEITADPTGYVVDCCVYLFFMMNLLFLLDGYGLQF
jgi:hypothetical protein